MASLLRGLGPLVRTAVARPKTTSVLPPPICFQCRRNLTTSSVQLSGHNKWSKIKHKKAAADKKISKVNSYLCKQLTLYSKRPCLFPRCP
jgi:hypothetical protein